MIERIKLKSGSSIGQPNLEIDLTPITVFVGPNNSGKSRILIEIESFSRNTHGHSNDLILDDLIFHSLKKEEIEAELAKIEQVPYQGENLQPGHILIGKVNAQNNQASRYQVNKDSLVREAQNPSQSLGYYSSFLNMYTLRLDGTNRLNLLQE
jgi:predicted ATPase